MNEMMTNPVCAETVEDQRKTARYAERDGEMVAVAAMAFADGLQIAAARALNDEQ